MIGFGIIFKSAELGMDREMTVRSSLKQICIVLINNINKQLRNHSLYWLKMMGSEHLDVYF